MKAAALAALLLVGVRAGAETPSARETPCACAAKKRCWNLVMTGFARRVALSEEEVEKGLPNRFFPRTVTFVMRRPSEDGHFLIVECGPRRVPCAAERGELERRMIMVDILASLPLFVPEDTLFDPVTWVVSERGEKEYAELKTCRKGLSAELAAVVLQGGE